VFEFEFAQGILVYKKSTSMKQVAYANMAGGPTWQAGQHGMRATWQAGNMAGGQHDRRAKWHLGNMAGGPTRQLGQ
jgi:hypothetical protein